MLADIALGILVILVPLMAFAAFMGFIRNSYIFSIQKRMADRADECAKKMIHQGEFQNWRLAFEWLDLPKNSYGRMMFRLHKWSYENLVDGSPEEYVKSRTGT